MMAVTSQNDMTGKKSPGCVLIAEVIGDGISGSQNYEAVKAALPDYWEMSRVRRRGGYDRKNKASPA